MSHNNKEDKMLVSQTNINSDPIPSTTELNNKEDSKKEDSQGYHENNVQKFIYKSEAMSRLMSMVYKMSSSEAPVLILGESGTGKELLAKAIHNSSPRKKSAFVAVNCGALRESLLESELFGHEKGAFTGAYTKKIGLVEKAHKGTLFLDEIGDLEPGIQAKLLRFLQSGEFYRVGDKQLQTVDVRIISATNKPLEKDVEEGKFREDLFYRLNTVILKTSPLRRRREDIRILFDFFMSQKKKSSQVLALELKISNQVYSALENYNWPGNVRELENLCERLNVMCEGGGVVELKDLPQDFLTKEVSSHKFYLVEYDPAVSLADLERQYIIQALNHFKCNKTQVANALGITIKTLYNKLHEYGEFERFSIQSASRKKAK